MLVTRLSPVLIGLLLAGCSGMTTAPSPEPAPLPPRVEAGSECGAKRVQEHIGHAYSQALDKTIRTESGAATVRVIRPGMAVTLDYRANRLNVHLDESDRISEIGCG